MSFRVSPVFKRQFNKEATVVQYKQEEVTTLSVDDETGDVVEEKTIINIPVVVPMSQSDKNQIVSPVKSGGISMRSNTKSSYM